MIVVVTARAQRAEITEIAAWKRGAKPMRRSLGQLFALAWLTLGAITVLLAAVPLNGLQALTGEPVRAGGCAPLTATEIADSATAVLEPGWSVRREDVESPAGELEGYRLEVATTSGSTTSVDLPAESFVAEPTGELLVYGWHSPRAGSKVRLMSLRTACDQFLVSPENVVRSAVLNPAGDSLYIHAVTAERSDAGVTRVDLATGLSVLATRPFPYDEALGPTFATRLEWSAEGTELAVQACGFAACRTRVVSDTSGEIADYVQLHGPLVGLTSEALYTLADHHVLPTDVLEVKRADFTLRIVAEDVLDASVELVEGSIRIDATTLAGRLEVQP